MGVIDPFGREIYRVISNLKMVGDEVAIRACDSNTFLLFEGGFILLMMGLTPNILTYYFSELWYSIFVCD